MLFYLQITEKAVPLHCVFHSIRFKVNKGWSKALLLFLCPYVSLTFRLQLFTLYIVNTTTDWETRRETNCITKHRRLKLCYP